MRIDARTAWISGASSGIGAVLAKKLASQGVEVILSARRRPLLEELAEEIREAGGRARVEPMDVSQADATVQALQRLDEEVGGIDLVIANAGVGGSTWAGELAWEEVETTIEIFVAGAAAALVALLPRMVERGRGHLVGISSLAGYRGMPASAAYSASKAYLSVFLESLRIDLAGTGVAVTDVRPGFIRTPMTAKNRFRMPFLLEVDDAAERILRGIARKRPVVAFPRPLSTGAALAPFLPRWLWERLATRRGPGVRPVFEEKVGGNLPNRGG